jgi:formate hydrogenlyase subunit 4
MRWLDWLTQALEVVAALIAAPLFLGWVNQCRAWLSNRSAPSVLQPYRGIRKLFHKDAVLATGASPLFRLAPYVVFATMVLAAAVIPSMGTHLPFTPVADAIALVGLLATARMFLALAAMDVGTAFGTLGARREMMIGFLAEPALLMVIFVAALSASTTAQPDIAGRLATQPLALYPSIAFTGVAFTMVLLALVL